MQFGIFDDSFISNFFPITYSRSFALVRTGFYTQKEFFSQVFGQPITYLKTIPHLQKFYRNSSDEFSFKTTNEDIILINSRIRNIQEIKTDIQNLKNCGDSLWNHEILLAIRISGNDLNSFFSADNVHSFSKHKFAIETELFLHSWELILQNHKTMTDQLPYFLQEKQFNVHTENYQNQSIGSGNIYVGKNVFVHPFVSFDLRHGDIILDNHSEIMAHSALSGPCYVGEHSKIKIGAKIYKNTIIGPVCKIGGEVEDVIIQGYSNKQHDGFLGHAFLGEWCNLGADTNNSDLKNNYASVDIWENGKMVDTGSQFMGAIFGDHSKTGINTQLNTGTVVGFSSNIFGSGFPDRLIPSFYWSADGRLLDYRMNKAKETAKIVMGRRNVEFTDSYSALFDDIKILSGIEQNSIKKK